MNKIIIAYDDNSDEEHYLNGFTEKGPRWIKSRKLPKTYNTATEALVVMEGVLQVYSPPFDSLVIGDK